MNKLTNGDKISTDEIDEIRKIHSGLGEQLNKLVEQILVFKYEPFL